VDSPFVILGHLHIGAKQANKNFKCETNEKQVQKDATASNRQRVQFSKKSTETTVACGIALTRKC
jgi:hypothetical protein